MKKQKGPKETKTLLTPLKTRTLPQIPTNKKTELETNKPRRNENTAKDHLFP
jgi:hypothetical protein